MKFDCLTPYSYSKSNVLENLNPQFVEGTSANDEHLVDDARLVEDIYRGVLDAANVFLNMAYRLQFDLNALRATNPSAEQVAKTIRFLISAIKDATFDTFDQNNKVLNAVQCCNVMEQIALAIVDEHVENLQRSLLELKNLIHAPF